MTVYELIQELTLYQPFEEVRVKVGSTKLDIDTVDTEFKYGKGAVEINAS